MSEPDVSPPDPSDNFDRSQRAHSDVPTIAYAIDPAFIMPLAVALQNLSSAHPSARVFILHDKVATEQQRRLAKTLPSSLQLRWIDVNTNPLDSVRVPDYLSRATLFCLLIDAMLPAELDRVLYLDADTLLCAPLDELWTTDLGDSLLAAVRDAAVPWVGAPRGLPWRTLGLEPRTPYFNSGVMLIPLARWRDEGIGRRALDLLAKHQFRWADQCALNAVVRGHWRIMKPRWNVQAAHVAEQGSLGWVAEPHDDMVRAIESPAIVHFNFSEMNRPWEPLCRHPLRQRWFDSLDATAWSGWRPREPRATAVAGAGRRLKRVFRVLLKGG